MSIYFLREGLPYEIDTSLYWKSVEVWPRTNLKPEHLGRLYLPPQPVQNYNQALSLQVYKYRVSALASSAKSGILPERQIDYSMMRLAGLLKESVKNGVELIDDMHHDFIRIEWLSEKGQPMDEVKIFRFECSRIVQFDNCISDVDFIKSKYRYDYPLYGRIFSDWYMLEILLTILESQEKYDYLSKLPLWKPYKVHGETRHSLLPVTSGGIFCNQQVLDLLRAEGCVSDECFEKQYIVPIER